MKLAVVIIHYNSSADLDRCLESLVAYAPAVEHHVIIVDNQSTDEGLEAVHQRYPQFLWIFSEENLGYSRRRQPGHEPSGGGVLSDPESRHRGAARGPG